MNTIVEMIQKIGIFMIAAQAVIHFAPGQKYEKYMKLLVGIMILLQFIVPVKQLLGEEANDMTGWLEKEPEWESGITFSPEHASKAEETALLQLEDEIKSKLNNYISEDMYKITDVIITREEDELDTIQVEMQRMEMQQQDSDLENSRQEGQTVQTDSASDKETNNMETIKIETVRVEPVTTGGTATEKNASQSREEEDKSAALQFRKQFSEILGIQEEKMEVIVYGSD